MGGHSAHLADLLQGFADADVFGVVAALGVAGLVGGWTHCAGMCGPFVLGQATARLGLVPVDRLGAFTRAGGALLVPYHLGRATTYAALGAFGAAVVGGFARLSGSWLPAAFLLLAALLFIAAGARGFGFSLPVGVSATSPWAERIVRPLRGLFARPVGWRGYLIGVALGFLPCGLLYGALAAAAGTGRPAVAALAMAAFALGTAPPLVALALAGHLAARRWRTAFAGISSIVLMINGLALSYLAWRMIA